MGQTSASAAAAAAAAVSGDVAPANVQSRDSCNAAEAEGALTVPTKLASVETTWSCSSADPAAQQGGSSGSNAGSGSHGSSDALGFELAGHWRGPLAAAAVAAVSYYNALDGELLFDDAFAIVQNPDVYPGITSWWSLWANDFWGFPLCSKLSHKSYRPLATLSFRAQVFVAGGFLDARTAHALHTVNVALHVTNSALLAIVGKVALGLSAGEASATAVFFAAHPVHVEAVTGVVGRCELLAAMFVLLALLATARASAAIGSHPGSDDRAFVGAAVALLGSAALLCKETAAGTLPLCAALDVFVALQSRSAAASGARAGGHDFHARRAILRATSFLLCAVILVSARVALNGGLEAQPMLQPESNPGAFSSPSWKARTLTLHYYLASHIALLFWPAQLCCDWSHSSIPLLVGFNDLRAVGALLAVHGPCSLTMAMAAIAVTKDWHTSGGHVQRFAELLVARSLRSRPWILGVLLLVLFMLPSSNLLLPVGFTVAERVLYLPSMGVCVLASLQLSIAWRFAGRGRIFIAALVLALVAAGVCRCWSRNADWQTAETLYRSGVSVNPLNEKLHDLLATRLHNSGRDHSETRFHAERAITINPSYWHAHATVGQLNVVSGDTSAAVASYRRALELAEAQGLAESADAPKVRLNLAMLLQDKVPAEAELHFRKVVGGQGSGSLQGTALVVFGAFLESAGSRKGPAARLQEAAHSYRKALASSGNAASADAAHIRLGAVLIKQLRHAESEGVRPESLPRGRVSHSSRTRNAALPGAKSRPTRVTSLPSSWPDELCVSTPTVKRRPLDQTEGPQENTIQQSGAQQADCLSRQTLIARCPWLVPPRDPDGGHAAGAQLDLIHLLRVNGDGDDRSCFMDTDFATWGAIATEWLYLTISHSSDALARARDAARRVFRLRFPWLTSKLFSEEASFAGPTRGLAATLAATAMFPAAPSAEAALQHLRRGLALRPTAESAALDPGGQRRAQALALVAARLASAGRSREASVYLGPVHAEPAVALRILGMQRLKAGDVATGYEALLVSANLGESVETHLGLAVALERAGNEVAAAQHRWRAEVMGGRKKR